jgi:hypothetical protein
VRRIARVTVLEGECRGASDHPQIADFRQHGDHLLAEAIHERRVLLITADVRKRKHGY